MITVAALYHFARVPDPEALAATLRAEAEAAAVKGSLILAGEGVNGTIAGTADGVRAVIDAVRREPGFGTLSWKESAAAEMPFARLKVRVKAEIVTMGQPSLNTETGGSYVPPEDWNALIREPDVAVIDTRNAYEVDIGTFAGAVDPGTRRFRDFPAWWDANHAEFAGKRIAMFCTGGIRCEKSTAFLKSRGVEDVYHLKGGILKYLETVPEAESDWRGACFVFDERVALGHGLEAMPFALCRACGHPLSEEDRAHPDFEEGVACHHCAESYTESDRARFRERQRQTELAQARGGSHLGPPRDPSGA
ncbi:rhodanese-related sulfurtransferase [Acuticoccus sp. MNP-M23]|uniref:oxygen-dependent tRNA uridine(34) hydroxylase TrhO n=1 Tax=Acuticoccus sp. MNP-M23 TaxID=3072793 RepID=UPI0028164DD6|nr:rhodanese-related sulfurtransferase [Acuticoccus sp. MNP-M23]WMS43826.1 rhodanese-related sulfurtransferase [Acuticoccus sp. MNP-M23]